MVDNSSFWASVLEEGRGEENTSGKKMKKVKTRADLLTQIPRHYCNQPPNPLSMSIWVHAVEVDPSYLYFLPLSSFSSLSTSTSMGPRCWRCYIYGSTLLEVDIVVVTLVCAFLALPVLGF